MFGIIPFGTSEDMPRRRFPFITVAFILINLAVFGYQLMLVANGGIASLNDFVARYAVVPQATLAHGWIDPTLLTAMFLHGGFMHLGSNMLFLAAFGDNVEDRLGHLRYLLLYLAWGVAGSVAHILFNPDSTVPSLGASGAIAGVLGAYLVLFPRGIVRAFLFVFLFFTITRLPAILMIGSWFLIQLFSGIGSLGANTSQTGGVAFWAHIGGFVIGLITAAVLAPRLTSRGYDEDYD